MHIIHSYQAQNNIIISPGAHGGVNRVLFAKRLNGITGKGFFSTFQKCLSYKILMVRLATIDIQIWVPSRCINQILAIYWYLEFFWVIFNTLFHKVYFTQSIYLGFIRILMTILMSNEKDSNAWCKSIWNSITFEWATLWATNHFIKYYIILKNVIKSFDVRCHCHY